MDEMLKSISFEDNSEDLRFGDDSQKMEKMKQSFLIIKKKMCVTKDLMEKYSEQIQKNNELMEKFKRKCGEYERMKNERDSMSEEFEKLKQQGLTNRAKALKFDMEKNEYEQTQRRLRKELDEKNTKIASDQQHIQQLICKIGDEEDRFSEKIMEKELEISCFQARIRDLEQGLIPKKKRGKQFSSPLKAMKKKSLSAIDEDEFENIPIIKEATPEPVIILKKDYAEIGVNTDEIRKPIIEAPQIIMTITPELSKKITKDSSINTDEILPPPKPKSFNAITMTDEFYDTRKTAYPLFCDECEKSFTSIPIDKIFKTMTSVPPLIPPVPPSPIKTRINHEESRFNEPAKNQNIQNNSLDSTVTMEIQKKIKSLERRLKKREKIYESTLSRCGHGPPVSCCGHNQPVRENSQVEMMAEFWARMMNFNNQGISKRQEKTLRRKKKVKKLIRKRKVSVASVRSVNMDDWDIQHEPPQFENTNDSEEVTHYFTPIVKPSTSTFNHSEKSFFNSANSTETSFHENFHRSRENNVSTCEQNHQKFNNNNFRTDDHSDFSNIELEPENIRNPEESIFQARRSTRNSENLETEIDCTSRKRKRCSIEEEAKPTPKIRSNLMKNLRKLTKNTSSVAPVKFVKNNEIFAGKSDSDQPAKRKRIAHIPKPADEETTKNVEELLKSTKKVVEKDKHVAVPAILTEKRVTRSLFKSSEISTPPNPAIGMRAKMITQMKPPPRRSRKNSVSQNQSTNQISKLENLFGDISSEESIHSSNQQEANKDDSKKSEIENTNETREKIIIPEIGEKEISIDLQVDKCDLIKTGYNENIQNDQEINTPVIKSSIKSPEKINSSPSSLIPPENNVEEKPKIEISNLDPPQASLEIKKERMNEDDLSQKNNIFDESPASPDPEDLEELPSINPIPSIYETAVIVENSKSSNELDEFSKIPSNSETCVKELRNRSVSVSPKKLQQPIKESLTSSAVESLPERINIEFFLNRHLKENKNKNKKTNSKLCRKISLDICKKNEDMVKEELKKLIDSEEWSNEIHQSVAKKILETKSPKLISKCVVELLLEISENKDSLDKTYTPPAPLMTKNEQKIVALLATIETELSDIISWIFKSIEGALFKLNSAPEFEGVECLARIFTVLARMKKDREKVRLMICDALYCLQKKALIVLFAVLTSWPEVLPEYNAEKVQLLPLCIAHVISSDAPSHHVFQQKINQVKKLVKVYYQYPHKSDDPMSKALIGKLMENLTKNPDRSVETAIILLAKREGTAWTFKNIINVLIEIIIDRNHPSIYIALKVLGFLLRSFPATDEEGNVQKIINQLRKLIDVGSGPPKFQEGVISALLSLSRFQFKEIALTVLNWHPPGILSPLVYEQLEIFFKSRNAPVWNGIKHQSRIYLTKHILPLQKSEREKMYPTTPQ